MLWQIQSQPTVTLYQGAFDITPPIAAPYDLAVTDFIGGPPWVIEFSWQFDFGDWGDANFEIQRNVDGGAFSTIATQPTTNPFTYTDTLGPVPPPPPNNSTVGYRIRYTNGVDVGPWSSTMFVVLSPV